MQSSGKRGQPRVLMLSAEWLSLCNIRSPQEQKGEGCIPEGNTTGHSSPSLHACRTKEIFSSLYGDTFASFALRLPWTVHQKNLSLHMGPPDSNISLVELLVSTKNSLTDLTGSNLPCLSNPKLKSIVNFVYTCFI